MPNKTYGQFCPLARSLDVLGDRWMLLIVRELLLGPKRFKELLAILPAMGANRLSARLTALVDSGVIRQIAISNAKVTRAYELTEMGEGLRKPILSLAFWGMGLPVDARIEASTMRAELIALSLTGSELQTGCSRVQGVYEFHIGAETFHIRMNDHNILVRSGLGGDLVDAAVRCDMATFFGLVQGEITPAQALSKGRVALLGGSTAALLNALAILKAPIMIPAIS